MPRTRNQFEQQRHDLLQPLIDGQRRRLHRQIFAVAIDDQAAQAIGFAEHQPRGSCWIGVAQLSPQFDGGFQPPPKERLVQQFAGVPRV